MVKIEYSHELPRVRFTEDFEEIFCVIRKKWLVLTPEEWVRQNFLHHLIHTLHFPASLIAVEKKLTLGEMIKRFDIIIYTNKAEPYMIIECKEMNIPLSENVMEQVMRYNIPLRAPYLIITNGSYSRVFKLENNQISEIENIPELPND